MEKKTYKIFTLLILIAVFLTACESSMETTELKELSQVEQDENIQAEAEDNSASGETVIIEDIHGNQEVPVKPQRVISLDNRTFDTLEGWGIELLAVPKDVMTEDSAYFQDDEVENIGNHREPNLELIAALEPELVIIGQRFASHYEDIKALVPNASVIDFSFDVSEEAENPGENLIEGLKNTNRALGLVFGKEKEAEELANELDQSISLAKEAYRGEDSVMAIVVSAGEIGFSAPKSGRVWGPLYEVFGWKSALEIDNASSDHEGDDISVEAIAASDPDWILVLDRDAAVSSGGEAKPAKDVIENSPALQNTKAILENNLIYAPDDTYTNESLQTYTKLFNNIAEAMGE